MVKRWVKFDKYELLQVRRDHHLTANEMWLLTALVLVADFRSRQSTTTIVELAGDVGMSSNTVRKAIRRLTEERLIRVVHPFGRGVQGTVEISAYDRIVYPERNAQISATTRADLRAPEAPGSPSKPSEVAARSRRDRADDAQARASATRLTSSSPSIGGSEAVREVGPGADDLSEHAWEMRPFDEESEALSLEDWRARRNGGAMPMSSSAAVQLLEKHVGATVVDEGEPGSAGSSDAFFISVPGTLVSDSSSDDLK
jgi:hypothetical protein